MEKYSDLFEFVVPSVLLIVWLARLEAKIIYNEREIDKHEKILDAFQNETNLKIDKLTKAINDIQLSLMRIETRLTYQSRENNNKED